MARALIEYVAVLGHVALAADEPLPFLPPDQCGQPGAPVVSPGTRCGSVSGGAVMAEILAGTGRRSGMALRVGAMPDQRLTYHTRATSLPVLRQCP
jgi:hypothetical protein